MRKKFSFEIESFIRNYVNELNESNAAIFAGAGLSMPAGYVNWKELLRPLAEELNVNIDRENDLVSLAQYFKNANGRQRLNQRLLDEIGICKEPTENHEILSRLPIGTYWTTNYDKLIEKSLDNVGKIVDFKYTVNQLAITKKGRSAVLYKMHGDVDNTDEAVITKDDYENYPFKFGPFINALSGDLVSKTFLFLGFSFTDPNLDYVMSRIRINFKTNQRQHFCIFKQVEREEFKSDEDFQHAKTKQELVISDLQRFSVKTLLVNNYADITAILSRIESDYRRKTIFFSGSASEFGTWEKTEVEMFLSRLGELIIDKGYKLSSGIGLGIGNALITGAIKSIYGKHGGNVSDYLTMRPFPQFIQDKKERDETWDTYRKEIIRYAGISLFFMGNKEDGRSIVNADGVRKEFEIANQLGLLLIPIGASGYMAKELADEVLMNLNDFYPDASEEFLSEIKALCDEVDEPNKLISKVIKILDLATE